MAEIGVLELEIRDNAGEASGGLSQLAGALSSVRQAVGGDKFGLSKVGTELNALARQVNGAKSGTPTIIKNVTSLMNSLTAFSKVKSIKIDTESLGKLKDAIGQGFNIGNSGTQLKAMREALDGEWQAEGAATSMKAIALAAGEMESQGTAGTLKAVADAMKKYKEAYNALPKSTDKMTKFMSQFSDNFVQKAKDAVADVKKSTEEVTDGIEDATEGVVDYTKISESWNSNIELPFHEPVKRGRKKKQVPGQTEMDLGDSVQQSAEGIQEVKSDIQECTESAKEFKVVLLEVKDMITSIAVDNIRELNNALEQTTELGQRVNTSWDSDFGKRADITVEQIRKVMDAWIELKNSMALGSGENIPLLGSGGVAPENMLSTFVDLSKQWKQNFAFSENDGWKPDFTFVDDTIDKTQLVEMAFHRIEQMKEQLVASVKGGLISEEAASAAAKYIDSLEAKIPIIQEAWSSSAETITESFTQGVETVASNPSFITEITSSVEFLTDRWKDATNQAGIYGSKVGDYILPRMNELSSEEMIIAKNGEMASAAIERLISRLNKVDNKNGKGFSNIVDIVTGVSRDSNNPAKEAAKAFDDDFFARIDKVDSFMYRLNHPQNAGNGWSSETFDKILGIGQETEKVLDETTSMFNVPAMNNEGPFKTASEEIEHYSEMLRKAKEDMEFWSNEYDRIKKQIKYNGATDERTNALGQAEQSFMASVEKIDEYESKLKEAIEYANEYSKAMQQVETVTAEGGQSEAVVFSSIEEAAKAMGITVEEAMQKVKGPLDLVQNNNPSVNVFSSIEEAAKAMGITVEEARQKIEETLRMAGIQGVSVINTQNLEQASNEIKKTGGAVEDLKTRINDAPFLVDQFVESYSHIDYLKGKLEELKSQFGNKMKLGLLDNDETDAYVMKLRKLSDEIAKLEQVQGAAGETSRSFNFSWKDFSNGIKKAFPTLSGLIKRFSQIAKYRMLRAILKQITEGVSEGLQNVYQYSKAVGTDFAPAMDSAASALAQMKNSIGASLTPVIISLIPVLQTVVSWFTTLINYVNQFFALLAGRSSWTHALQTNVDAYTNSVNAAGGATKDLLADWDELNIIQSESGGGGGGGKKPQDFGAMFEELDVFDEKVKNVVDKIKDNMDLIKAAALTTGKLILGWKVSKAFKGVLASIGKLTAAAAIIELTWEVTNFVDHMYLEDGNDGWLVADVLTNFVGDYLAGRMVGSVLGGGAGAVTMGLSLAVSGGISYGIALANPDNDDSNALKTIGLVKAGIGAIITSLGFTAIEGSLAVGLAAGFGTALPLFTAVALISYIIETNKNAHKIAAEAFKKGAAGGISLEDLYGDVQKHFDAASKKYKVTIDIYSNIPKLRSDISDSLTQIGLLTAVLKGEGKLTQKEAEEFKKAWETALSAFTSITDSAFNSAISSLNQALTSANEEIRKQAKELRISTLIMQENITEAEAEFMATMQELENKVAYGTASKEEFEKYERYVNEMALASDTLLSSIENLSAGAKKVDVSDQTAVADYITKINESYQEAMAQIDEGLNAGIDSWNILKKRNEMYHNLGYIKDDVYEQQKTLIDAAIEAITAAAEDDKKRVETAKQQAIESILGSTMEGLKFLPINEHTNAPDVNQVAAYMKKFVRPVVNAIEEAGGEVPEEIKKALEDSIDIDTILFLTKNQKWHLKNAKERVREFIKNWLGIEYLKDAGKEVKEEVNEELESVVAEPKAGQTFWGNLSEYGKNYEKKIEASKDRINEIEEEITAIVTKPTEMPDFWEETLDESNWNFWDDYWERIQEADEKRKKVISELKRWRDDNEIITLRNEIKEKNKKEKIDQLYEAVTGESPKAIVDSVQEVIEEAEKETYHMEPHVEEELIIDDSSMKHSMEIITSQMDEYGNVTFHVTPDIELSKDGQHYLQMIENAVNSGKGIGEITAAMGQANEMFGIEAFLEAQPYIQQLIDAYKELQGLKTGNTSGFVINPAMITASAGMSDSGRRFFAPPQSYTSSTNNDVDISGDVETGVQKGMSDQNGLIGQLISICTRIANKEFSVTVMPTAGWGGFNKRSNAQFEKITGGDEP